MSENKITFVSGRDKTEQDSIVIWAGNVEENDIYEVMKENGLNDLSHCDIVLRSDHAHPSLKYTINDNRLIPNQIICLNGCEINLSIPPSHIRQDRYRTIYSFKGDPFANTNIVSSSFVPNSIADVLKLTDIIYDKNVTPEERDLSEKLAQKLLLRKNTQSPENRYKTDAIINDYISNLHPTVNDMENPEYRLNVLKHIDNIINSETKE
jgi:hypothetical protein